MRGTRFLAAALLWTGCTLSALAQGGTGSPSYMQTFDGMPPAPAAYRPPGWDVQIHSRDPETWDALEPMTADHGTDCAAPPAQHDPTGDYPSHVFQCHDHMMTSIKADGYGVIYLTPPALLDWSAGEATLRWDMSTLRTSLRDWVDVWLTPYDDHLALPLETDFVVDLAGAPPNNIHLQMGSFNGESTWLLNGTAHNTTVFNAPAAIGFTWPSIETTVAPAGGPSAARRDTFELRVRDGHVVLDMPALGQTWIDEDVASVGFTKAVVTFGHHSYFPQKACDGMPAGSVCPPDTWHWDNVSLNPATPIQITSLTPRQYTDATGPGAWVFPAPALPDTTLQFAADSAPDDVPGVDLSWDGGTTWQRVPPAPSSTAGTLNHAHSYRVAVPVGATSVQVRGTPPTGVANWRAKDAALWRATIDAPPTATPLPASPTPTATALPGATSTPRPACVVQVQRDGVTVVTWPCEAVS